METTYTARIYEAGNDVPSVGAEAEESRSEGATLTVYTPGRPAFRYLLDSRNVAIGRSAKVGNDIVLESDSLCSKRHAAIEQDADGRYTLYDLGSTNGTKVNGEPIDNRTLCDADEIELGQSRLQFRQPLPLRTPIWAEQSIPAGTVPPESAAPWETPQTPEAEEPKPSAEPKPTPARLFRLVLMDHHREVKDFLLDTETLAGRSETNAIVLSDPSVAAQHARLFFEDGGYHIEPLHDSAFATLVNGRPLLGRQSYLLLEGDSIQMGDLALRFASGIRAVRPGVSANAG